MSKKINKKAKNELKKLAIMCLQMNFPPQTYVKLKSEVKELLIVQYNVFKSSLEDDLNKRLSIDNRVTGCLSIDLKSIEKTAKRCRVYTTAIEMLDEYLKEYCKLHHPEMME